MDKVRGWWSSYSFSGTLSYVLGTLSYVLARKLKALKEDLKVRNKQVFGDVGSKKQLLLGNLASLDENESLCGLSSVASRQRAGCKAKLERVAHLEEISWQNKSHFLWLKEGDNNTKFFHKMVNSNIISNYMERVGVVDGVEYETRNEVREKVVQFYKSLYQEEEEWRPTVDGLNFDRI